MFGSLDLQEYKSRQNINTVVLFLWLMCIDTSPYVKIYFNHIAAEPSSKCHNVPINEPMMNCAWSGYKVLIGAHLKIL